MFKCEYCQREFKTKKGLSTHYRHNKSCQIQFYVDRDKQQEKLNKLKTIECKICGKKLRYLSNTHLKTHNLTIKQYKELYPNEKIFTDDLLQEQTKKRMETLNELYPNNEYATKDRDIWIKEKYGSEEFY